MFDLATEITGERLKTKVGFGSWDRCNWSSCGLKGVFLFFDEFRTNFSAKSRLVVWEWRDFTVSNHFLRMAFPARQDHLMELLASGHLKARGWGADAYAVHANSLPIAAALSGFYMVSGDRSSTKTISRNVSVCCVYCTWWTESYASNQRQAKWTSAIDVL